jgi:hypothetical protein
LRTAAETVGKLPAIVDKAEQALDEYETEKRSSSARNRRLMIVSGFWLLAIVGVLLIWRLIG